MILRTSLLLLCLTSAASAQQRLAVDVAIEFIIGNCYHTLDDVSRVESAARLMKWEMLPAEASNMLKPVEGSGSALWHAQYEGQHFLVGVNRGMFEGRPAEVCSVVANLRPDDLLPRLLRGLKARKAQEDVDPVQVNEFYKLEHPTQDKVFMNIVRARNGAAPVSIGFISVH